MSIVIPKLEEKTPPTKRWGNQKFLMIGAGKIGKSEFWAQGERTLFCELEAGLNHLRVNKVSCRSWEDVGELYGGLLEAKKAGTLQYDTLVFDTIDRLAALASEEVVQRGKDRYSKVADQIYSIGDIPNGNGWAWQTEMITNMLSKFEALGMAVVLIGHVATKEIKEPTRTTTKDTISLGGQTGTRLLHWADHTLHVRSRMVGETIQRALRTKPTDTMEAGSRGTVVPDGMMWGPDAAANYATFRKLFE
jgi:KaiC/GvpD/RAD55 family RecA-like ATPase